MSATEERITISERKLLVTKFFCGLIGAHLAVFISFALIVIGKDLSFSDLPLFIERIGKEHVSILTYSTDSLAYNWVETTSSST
jgi:hypothetical protein